MFGKLSIFKLFNLLVLSMLSFNGQIPRAASHCLPINEGPLPGKTKHSMFYFGI